MERQEMSTISPVDLDRRLGRLMADHPGLVEFLASRRGAIRAAIRRGQLVPLLPRHRVYLQVAAGDGRRFARLFLATWGRIPLYARRLMLSVWRARRWSMPDIWLAPGSYLPRRAYGNADDFGHRLTFRAAAIARMPDDVVQDLIAHELAHVCQSARGVHCVRQYRDGRAEWADRSGEPWGSHFDIECGADDEMTHWGFDADSIDTWALEAGEIEVRDYRDEQEAMAAFRGAISRMLRKGR